VPVVEQISIFSTISFSGVFIFKISEKGFGKTLILLILKFSTPKV
jgi:hypothetical protein